MSDQRINLADYLGLCPPPGRFEFMTVEVPAPVLRALVEAAEAAHGYLDLNHGYDPHGLAELAKTHERFDFGEPSP
jgi:hypothetical protein